jgi:hypothetical protein
MMHAITAPPRECPFIPVLYRVYFYHSILLCFKLPKRKRKKEKSENSKLMLASSTLCFYLNFRAAVPRDLRVLPRRIVLVRHAESEGNVDAWAYTYLPDPQVPLVRFVLVYAFYT